METDQKTISTPALAYLGDCVLELCVREMLVRRGMGSSAALNREALAYVRATAQADAMMRILPLLTEEEKQAYHRGRNMGHSKTPKSATVGEYRIATGMEALFGYLHLRGDHARIAALFAAGFPAKDSIPPETGTS